MAISHQQEISVLRSLFTRDVLSELVLRTLGEGEEKGSDAHAFYAFCLKRLPVPGFRKGAPVPLFRLSPVVIKAVNRHDAPFIKLMWTLLELEGEMVAQIRRTLEEEFSDLAKQRPKTVARYQESIEKVSKALRSRGGFPPHFDQELLIPLVALCLVTPDELPEETHEAEEVATTEELLAQIKEIDEEDQFWDHLEDFFAQVEEIRANKKKSSEFRAKLEEALAKTHSRYNQELQTYFQFSPINWRPDNLLPESETLVLDLTESLCYALGQFVDKYKECPQTMQARRKRDGLLRDLENQISHLQNSLEGCFSPLFDEGRSAAEIDETAEQEVAAASVVAVQLEEPKEEKLPKEAAEPGTVSQPDPEAKEQERDEKQVRPKEELEREQEAADFAGPDRNDSLETVQYFLALDRAPSDEELAQLVLSLVADADMGDQGRLTEAVLLAKAAENNGENKKCSSLYQQLSLGTKLGINGEIRHSGEALSSIFSDENEIEESLMLPAYLYALLSPYHAYDYTLQAQANQIFSNYEEWFPSYPQVKQLFHQLCLLHDRAPGGFSDSVISLLGDEADRAAFGAENREKAERFSEPPNVKTKMKGLPELVNSCFGKDSDLQLSMRVIAENRRDEQGLVKMALEGYCQEQNGVLELVPDLIENEIDRAWAEATKDKSTRRVTLEYLARKQVRGAFQERLDLMQTWVELEERKRDKDLPILAELRLRILREIDGALAQLQDGELPKYGSVVVWMLGLMRNRLSGHKTVQHPFAPLLRTGLIPLSDEWMPILDIAPHDIKYYEPWRNVLKHIAMPKREFAEIRRKIFDPTADLFDNLQQLKMIGRCLNDNSGKFSVSHAQLVEAAVSAEDWTKRFMEKLELAYTYNRIGETDKESLSAIVGTYQELFFAVGDFSCWRRFLRALEKQVDELALGRKINLASDLQARRALLEEPAPLLIEAEKLLEKEQNFAVVEEYINRFDNGETELSDHLQAALNEKDSFAHFLSDEIFRPMYNLCINRSGRALKTFGVDFLERNMPEDWTARLKDDSRAMLSLWPTRKHASTTNQIRKLFQKLGLDVRGVKRVSGHREEVYHLEIVPAPKDQPDYRHPIALFGTNVRSPLPVVILYGNFPARQLVDTITSLNLGSHAIVLIDRPIERSARRQIAEIFHETSGQNPFLLIDQVLFLHLALHQETERLPAMLKCTLPYTSYQPFVEVGQVCDEMFFGRVRELATIMDPNGASVVYGGRQLGKTALLKRAESLSFKPENKVYAVYCDINHSEDEATVVKKIISEINKETDLALTACTSIQEFCDELHSLFRQDKIKRMLLLLDEVDVFLGKISATGYSALQPLIGLKRATTNNFKFVLTGLHNVCRAKNATERNGIFGQLGTPLCIKPLSPRDALQLLSRPLSYLGFQIPDLRQLETILTNANYYPGVLQFFGYTLVQTLTSQYTKYYRAIDGNPPFTLQDEQLGAIMNSADLNYSIKEKLHLSLKIDPRYFMLARCITMLYHLYGQEATGSRLGFSVEQIVEMVDYYEISCLEGESRIGVTNLLDEMVEMGILSTPQGGTYRLRRHSFIGIIGADMDALEQDIIHSNDLAKEVDGQ